MLGIILIIILINSIKANYVMNGQFKECFVRSHQNMLKIEKCPDLNWLESEKENTTKLYRKEGEAIVFAKHQYVLEGIGQECSMKKRQFKLSTDIFGNKYTEHSEYYVKLTRYECLNMITNQICNGKKMSCKSQDQCIFIEERHPDRDTHPWWLGSHVFTLHECRFINRLVVTDSFEKNVLHGSIGTCKANDLYCELSQSVVIWEKDIIRKCPFERIMHIKDLRSQRNSNETIKFYYSKNQSVFFKVDSSGKKYEECGGHEFISTSEGLYLSIIKRVKSKAANETRKNLMKFPESNMKMIHLHENELRKVLLSQEDFALFTLLKMNLLSACSAFLNILRTNMNIDDSFVILNEMGYAKDLIIYFNNGISYLPMCNDVYNITVYRNQKIRNECFEDIQVLYKNEKSQKYIRGFLRKNGIITQYSKRISCEMMELNEKSIMVNDILIQKKGSEIFFTNFNHSLDTTIRTSLWNTNELQRLFDHNTLLTNGSSLLENIDGLYESHFEDSEMAYNGMKFRFMNENDQNDEMGFFGSIVKSIKNFFSFIYEMIIKILLWILFILLIIFVIYFILKCFFSKLSF